MKQISKSLTISVLVLSASLLGAGAASAAVPETHAHVRAAATASAARATDSMLAHPSFHSAALDERDAPSQHTGSRKHHHHDERLEDDEYELANAAPHTLWRFDAGSP
ncbi:MAG: hypothetical protein M3017_11840 [Actinomycetota bacterium]|nr:hypothetical protein [Actinomycetota bacterium]